MLLISLAVYQPQDPQIRLAVATTLIVVTVELVTDLQISSYVAARSVGRQPEMFLTRSFQEARIKNRVRIRNEKQRHKMRAGSEKGRS